MSIDLSRTHSNGYEPGRSYIVRATWLVIDAVFFLNPLIVSYGLKARLLRWYGARIGRGVVIKPGARVKYPWRLVLGDNCWIGERSWIDNMEDVVCEDNVVISQGAYICTGNHDWSDPGMPLKPRPVRIEGGVWIGAFAKVGPGRKVAEGSVVALGGVLIDDTEPYGVYAGNPAQRVSTRVVREAGAVEQSPRLVT